MNNISFSYTYIYTILDMLGSLCIVPYRYIMYYYKILSKYYNKSFIHNGFV